MFFCCCPSAALVLLVERFTNCSLHFFGRRNSDIQRNKLNGTHLPRVPWPKLMKTNITRWKSTTRETIKCEWAKFVSHSLAFLLGGIAELAGERFATFFFHFTLTIQSYTYTDLVAVCVFFSFLLLFVSRLGQKTELTLLRLMKFCLHVQTTNDETKVLWPLKVDWLMVYLLSSWCLLIQQQQNTTKENIYSSSTDTIQYQGLPDSFLF